MNTHTVKYAFYIAAAHGCGIIAHLSLDWGTSLLLIMVPFLFSPYWIEKLIKWDENRIHGLIVPSRNLGIGAENLRKIIVGNRIKKKHSIAFLKEVNRFRLINGLPVLKNPPPRKRTYEDVEREINQRLALSGISSTEALKRISEATAIIRPMSEPKTR